MLKFNALILISCVLVITASCSEVGGMNDTAKGAGIGAAVGAGTGAIIGAATGKAGYGTAIGAGLGALAGSGIGYVSEQNKVETARLENQVNQQQQMLDENRRLIEELKRQGTDARATERGVLINLPDVLFDFNKTNLRSDAVVKINKIADTIQSVQRRISVEGHTDAIGSDNYNYQLSYERAEAVAAALERRGVNPQNLQVRGFGKKKPVADNATESGRARNRRVEVIVEN
ncbi:MAG: OmpA family protein [Deltaproteobacteria bacterium]|jgi:outer membrane protein OmpA-like peptidoglycan-associated protein|nr:OmpA family protein [Deltaproteobacteria bacterium]